MVTTDLSWPFHDLAIRLEADVTAWPTGINGDEVSVTTDDQKIFEFLHDVSQASMWRERLPNVENFLG